MFCYLLFLSICCLLIVLLLWLAHSLIQIESTIIMDQFCVEWHLQPQLGKLIQED